jgi:hypothetical protein
VIHDRLAKVKARLSSAGEPSMVEASWFRSTYCGNSSCVEVSIDAGAGRVAVRDGKAPAGPLLFDFEEWQAFVQGVKSGEFDLPPS